MASSNIIGIPTDDKVFEENCIPLFAGLLKDPNVKLVGTSGGAQGGLDLIGRRDRDPAQPVGIQCKLKTRGDKLTEAEIRREVGLALAHNPPLTEYYIVTTARDDPAYDKLALELSQQQAQAGRHIDIQVWGWDTLQTHIRRDPETLRAFDPDYSASTNRLTTLGEEISQTQDVLVERASDILAGIGDMQARLSVVAIDTERGTALEAHLDASVDQYRDLMNNGKPRTALGLLETLQTKLDDKSSAAIRARVRANIGFAHLRLDDEAKAAALLGEAYVINPTDPKIRGHRVLALALAGDQKGAIAYAKEVLEDNPANAGAAGAAYQVASFDGVDANPDEFVPPELLGEKDVRFSRLFFLRSKGDDKDWWAEASAALVAFPNEVMALRAGGDALVDQAFSEGRILAGTAMTPAARDLLREGAAILQQTWDQVRLYEHAADPAWSIIGCNLLSAYRGLGDKEGAVRTRDQLAALGGTDPNIVHAIAMMATQEGDDAEVVRLLHSLPESSPRTMMMLSAWTRAEDWQAVLDFATPERRIDLEDEDRQSFDIMMFRARNASETDFDLDVEVDKLLEMWPLGTGAHIMVADVYRRDAPEKLKRMAEKTLRLFDRDTSFAHRVMFAQLSLMRGEWDDIIAALDGFVATDNSSEPLEWLGLAFANAAPRPRTRAFFASLPNELIETGLYARLAGAAEHNRGDLRQAVKHLRVAITADPSDLRAHLLLISALERDGKVAEAIQFLEALDETEVKGSPEDRMRLAGILRRHGFTQRSLTLGYRVAAANRDLESVAAAYPTLIFFNEALPDAVGNASAIGPDYWFSASGDTASDLSGVIDDEEIIGVSRFATTHPLSKAFAGKTVGDSVTIKSTMGPDRNYSVTEIKHKYVWLLHDIMESHAARFPESTSLVQVRMRENDIQNVLDIVRESEKRGRFITQTYQDFPVPAALVATMAKRSVVPFVEHLITIGVSLRTCDGTMEERRAAAAKVAAYRGRGAVLDTLTFWFAHRANLLGVLHDYFGKICISRSTVDELLELRGRAELNVGREYMTMGHDGDQAWRQVHTPEDTAAEIAAINAAIEAAQSTCEILASDGTGDNRLGRAMAEFGAHEISAAYDLARDHGLLLLSDDHDYRRLAAHSNVADSAWLQITLMVARRDDTASEEDYLRAVGMLAAARHDHVCYDAETLLKLRSDPQFGEYWFKAACEFIGGRKADPLSHVTVAIGFMAGVWATSLTDSEKGQACSYMLTKLIRFRADWQSLLYVVDNDLRAMARRSVAGASLASEYLEKWMRGHFFNVRDIRSLERIVQIATQKSLPSAAQEPVQSRRRRRRPRKG